MPGLKALLSQILLLLLFVLNWLRKNVSPFFPTFHWYCVYTQYRSFISFYEILFTPQFSRMNAINFLVLCLAILPHQCHLFNFSVSLTFLLLFSVKFSCNLGNLWVAVNPHSELFQVVCKSYSFLLSRPCFYKNFSLSSS